MSRWLKGLRRKSAPMPAFDSYFLVTGKDIPVVQTTAPLWIVVTLSLVVLNVYAPARPTVTERVLASLLILAAVVPSDLWLKGMTRDIPFFPIFSGIYAVYYAIPIFLLDKYTLGIHMVPSLPSRFIERALLLSLVGFCLLFIGYYGKHTRFLTKLTPKLAMEWNDLSNIKFLGAVIGCMGLSFYYVTLLLDLSPTYAQALVYLSELSLLSICILFMMQLVGGLGALGKLFLWGALLPSRVLLGLGAGVAGHGLEIGLLIIMVYTTIRRRIPMKAVAVIFLLFLFIYPVRNELRERTWYGRADNDPVQNVTMFMTIAKQIFIEEPERYVESWQPIVRRFSNLLTFTAVLELTPDQVPYWNGETYYPLLFKPIPRFLYPDKPVEVTGQTFGHRYGFLAANDYITTHNLPQLVEFFVNFGVLGLVVGTFLLGTFYRVLLSMFIHPKMGMGALIAAIYLSTSLFLIESALSLVVGGLFWSVIFLVFFSWGVKIMRPSRIIQCA